MAGIRKLALIRLTCQSNLVVIIVVSVLQILVSHELDGSVNHSEQSRDETFVEADAALVLDDLQEGADGRARHGVRSWQARLPLRGRR